MKGTIVENSLHDTSILQQLKITRTWQSDDWILHDVEVNEVQMPAISAHLADGPWYVHFWEPNTDNVVVVFKDKTFRIKHSDKATWADAVQYGKSIGIPEEQLDFLIH